MSEFFDAGYLVVRAMFASPEIDEMRAAFDRLERRARVLDGATKVGDTLFVVEPGKNGDVRIERIVWCGGVEPVLGAFGRSGRLLSLVAALLGSREMDQLINQAHIKNPGDGTAFHFHQDSYHRRYGTDLFHDVNGRGSFVQTLTALDPMDPENGGLLVVPGSHRRGHVPTGDGRLPEGAFDPSRAVPLGLGPGDVALLSPFTVHGSKENRAETKRRLFINGFSSPGANRREYPGCGRGLRLTAPGAGADRAA
jgi:ectoine hydroxylase-related dioxygenase (phytanoyl-CoA dioxygenase family)